VGGGTRVAQELNAEAAQPIVDVRVVNDLACEKHAAIGKALPGLIGVVDRAIHAVAKAELAREMNGEPAGLMEEPVGLDAFDQVAVIVLVQLSRNRLFQVEALSEDQRRGHYRGTKLASWSSGGMVMASSARSS